MPKLKTAFTVQTSTGPKLIASVISSKGPDLRLVIPREDKVFREGDGFVSLKQEYYSLHFSPDSAHCTFKHTLEFADGIKIDLGLSSGAPKTGGFAWLLSRLIPIMDDNDQYDFKPEKNTTSVDMGSFDEAISSLFFGVLISAPGVELETTEPLNLRKVAADFSHFRITILWGYGRLMAPMTGFTRSPVSRARINEQMLVDGAHSLEGLTANDAVGHVLLGMFATLEQQRQELIAHIPPGDERELLLALGTDIFFDPPTYQ